MRITPAASGAAVEGETDGAGEGWLEGRGVSVTAGDFEGELEGCRLGIGDGK